MYSWPSGSESERHYAFNIGYGGSNPSGYTNWFRNDEFPIKIKLLSRGRMYQGAAMDTCNVYVVGSIPIDSTRRDCYIFIGFQVATA